MRRIILILFAILCIAALAIGLWLKAQILDSNTNFENERSIYIPSKTDNDDLKAILAPYLSNMESFERVANWMKYKRIKSGHYLLESGTNNLELVRKLRAGDQTPVKLTFVKARTLASLSGMLTKSVEADSAKLYELLNEESFLAELKIDKEEILGRFIPNTYEFWWNTDERELVLKMLDESKKFWNSTRRARLLELGLHENEALTLASIVEEETNMSDEKSRVAGVYLNRLKNRWPLEADPTLKFALGDFEIKRVLNKHKEVESPYNTYKHQGLPPGPICTPSVTTIDAVLNAESHNYFFFCAREDFSGYHNFAQSLSEHNLNARRYQNALNQRKIF